MAETAQAPVVDDEWEVKPPPKKAGGGDSEWTVNPPQSAEAKQAAALGPSTMAASHAQTMAPLNTAEPGALPGTYAHAVKHGYREPAEDPAAQVEGANIGMGMGTLGGIGGAAKSVATKGLKAAAGPLIRGVGGSVAGGAAGGYGGRQIGGMFGPRGAEIGGRIGSTLGVIGGGLLGGFSVPEEPAAPFSNVSESSGPYRGPSSVQSPFEVPSSSSTVPEPRIAPGPALPKGGLPAAGPTTFQGGGAGGETVAKPSRTMILTPGEARSEAQMQQLATRRASERGMQFAGGMVPREGRGVPRTPTVVGPVEEYGGPRQPTTIQPEPGENRRVAAPGPPPSGVERRRPILGPALPHQVGDEAELARLQAQLKTHPEDAAKIQRAIDDLRHPSQ